MTGMLARRIGLGLCVGLSLCTLMVLLDRTRIETEPSITSAQPSGARLFSELLERSGLRVELNRNRWPRLRENELAVAFVRSNGSDIEWPDESEQHSPIRDTFIDLVAGGRTLVVFYVPEDFNSATALATIPTALKNNLTPTASPLRVSTSRRFHEREVRQNFWAANKPRLRSSPPLAVWGQKGSGAVFYESIEHGVVVHVTNGIGATNRFIDHGDNVRFFVSLVKGLAGSDGTVVFTEAAQGNIVDESLFSGIGGWARAAAWQMFALFLVIAWTCGVSFGLPLRDRRRQGGTRDLMEAFGNLMARRKSAQFPQRLILASIHRDLRRAVALPAYASDDALLARLPDGIATRLRHVEMVLAANPKAIPLEQMESLRRETREFRLSRSNLISEPLSGLQNER